MPKWLKLLLRLAVVAACVYYIVDKIEFDAFWQEVKQYEVLPMAAALMMSVPPYIVAGLRLRFLSERACGLWTCIKATLFCLGVNNIFPAKLGEIAKAFYLRRKGDVPLGRGLVIVLWERFFDLNVVLVLALVSIWGMEDSTPFVLMLGAVVVGGWVILLCLKLFPALGNVIERLIPVERLRLLYREVLDQLLCSPGPAYFVKLALYSFAFWGFNYGIIYGCAYWVGGLTLTPVQLLAAFVMAVLGMTVPSSPGGFGVFEAAMVFGLGWFGVGSEEALGVGLVMHAINFVPTTAVALVIMARSGLSMEAVRKSGGEEL